VQKLKCLPARGNEEKVGLREKPIRQAAHEGGFVGGMQRFQLS